jgi:hypothetical protein
MANSKPTLYRYFIEFSISFQSEVNFELFNSKSPANLNTHFATLKLLNLKTKKPKINSKDSAPEIWRNHFLLKNSEKMHNYVFLTLNTGGSWHHLTLLHI